MCYGCFGLQLSDPWNVAGMACVWWLLNIPSDVSPLRWTCLLGIIATDWMDGERIACAKWFVAKIVQKKRTANIIALWPLFTKHTTHHLPEGKWCVVCLLLCKAAAVAGKLTLIRLTVISGQGGDRFRSATFFYNPCSLMKKLLAVHFFFSCHVVMTSLWS